MNIKRRYLISILFLAILLFLFSNYLLEKLFVLMCSITNTQQVFITRPEDNPVLQIQLIIIATACFFILLSIILFFWRTRKGNNAEAAPIKTKMH